MQINACYIRIYTYIIAIHECTNTCTLLHTRALPLDTHKHTLLRAAICEHVYIRKIIEEQEVTEKGGEGGGEGKKKKK